MRHCDLHHENYLHICAGCQHDQIVADLTAVGFTVLTAAELRADREAIILATIDHLLAGIPGPIDRDLIIAAAEQGEQP